MKHKHTYLYGLVSLVGRSGGLSFTGRWRIPRPVGNRARRFRHCRRTPFRPADKSVRNRRRGFFGFDFNRSPLTAIGDRRRRVPRASRSCRRRSCYRYRTDSQSGAELVFSNDVNGPVTGTARANIVAFNVSFPLQNRSCRSCSTLFPISSTLDIRYDCRGANTVEHAPT